MPDRRLELYLQLIGRKPADDLGDPDWTSFYRCLKRVARKQYGINQFPRLQMLEESKSFQVDIGEKNGHHILIGTRILDDLRCVTDVVSEWPNRIYSLSNMSARHLVGAFSARRRWDMCLATELFAKSFKTRAGVEDYENFQRSYAAYLEERDPIDADFHAVSQLFWYMQFREDYLIRNSLITNSRSMQRFQKAFVIAHELAHFICETTKRHDDPSTERLVHIFKGLTEKKTVVKSLEKWRCDPYEIRSERMNDLQIDLILSAKKPALDALRNGCKEARADLVALKLLYAGRKALMKGYVMQPVQPGPGNPRGIGNLNEDMVGLCIYDAFLHSVLALKVHKIREDLADSYCLLGELARPRDIESLLFSNVEPYLRYYMGSDWLIQVVLARDGKSSVVDSQSPRQLRNSHREYVAAVHLDTIDDVLSYLAPMMIVFSEGLIKSSPDVCEENYKRMFVAVVTGEEKRLPNRQRSLVSRWRRSINARVQRYFVPGDSAADSGQ
jgi:IrrE N-terminal-like domain